jgi:DNA-binding transcriptional ArsR family regulator
MPTDRSQQVLRLADAHPLRDEDERLADICRALGNPVRLKIIRYIHDHPGCIGNQILLNLPDDLSRAQSTLSQHLKILCHAGLIEAEPDGHAVMYTLSQQCVIWLRQHLQGLEP